MIKKLIKEKISVVLPVYNEEENMANIVSTVKRNVSQYNYEIIIVDDGSTDKTRHEILKLTEIDNRVKAILFYRNFGHQAALLAGLNYAKGNAVITMDSDFQHPPEYIPTMLEKWKDGYDLVLMRKSNDSSSIVIRFFRIIGYKIYKLFGEKHLISGVSDFRLMDKNIVGFINSCPEVRVILRGLVMLSARNPIVLDYQVAKRRAGKSKYNFARLFNLVLFGITSFSLMPLRLGTILGFLLVLLSSIYLIYVLIARFILHVYITQGWTALMFVNVILFGFLFVFLGLLGEYIGAIFDEVKRRPRYLAMKGINITLNEM